MVDPLNWYRGNRILCRGYNNALAVTMEQIAITSLAFTLGQDYWTTVTPIQAASGSADDAAAGTGMRIVRVIGAKLDGTLQTSDLTLAGTTDSTASTEEYACIYAAYGYTYGTGLTNAGIIYIFDDGSTTTSGNPATPEEALIIPIGERMATKCNFIAPPGTSYYLKRLILGGAVQPVIAEINVWAAGLGGKSMVHKLAISNSGLWDMNMQGYPISIDAGEMIQANALSTTAAGQITLDMILEKA